MKAPPESLHERMLKQQDTCKRAVQFVVYYGSTTETQMCPPPSLHRLHYLDTGRAWWIISACGSVDVCQGITGEKSGGVIPSQRRMGAGNGHARPLPGPVGNLGATTCSAKQESKTGRDRKGGIESEWRENASLWRNDVPGYRQNRGPTDKESRYDSWIETGCVFRCLWRIKKAIQAHS